MLDLMDNVNYIVNKYADMICRIAYQYTRNIHEAKDIMQEVFVKMLKKLPFKDEEYLKAWLIRVTINQSKDFLKSKHRKNVPLEEGLQIAAKQQEDGLEELQQLPYDDRNIIYLYYYEGYSTKEIGKLLGKSANAVALKLLRARERLKSLIEESE